MIDPTKYVSNASNDIPPIDDEDIGIGIRGIRKNGPMICKQR